MHQLTRSVVRAALRLACRLTPGVAIAVALWPLPTVGADAVLNPGGASSVVAVEDVRTSGGTVSATLVNKSDKIVRDVQVLVRFAWLWRNERAPGHDNPGFSEFYTVFGDIPPGGSMTFTYTPRRSLSHRTDGSFEITVQVNEFTQVGD